MKRLFAKWKRRLFFNMHYFGNPPWDTGIPVPELVEFIACHEAGCALDLGCGSGTNMHVFLEAGWRVDGVDLACLATRNAKKKICEYDERANVYTADLTDIEFLMGKYDLIYDIGCYHGLDNESRIRYFENIKRLLANKGFYLVYGFYKTNGSGFGIDETDIDRFCRILRINNRLESIDDRGRAAVFIEFQRCENQL